MFGILSPNGQTAGGVSSLPLRIGPYSAKRGASRTVEVRLVVCFLKHQVIRLCFCGITEMQADDIYIHRARRRAWHDALSRHWARLRTHTAITRLHTPSPQLAEFCTAKRISSAGVTPAHIPGLFKKCDAGLIRRLTLKRIPIEIIEFRLNVHRNIHARRHLYCRIVFGLDPAIARERAHEQFLFIARIEHAKPDGEHEHLAFKRDLQRAKILGVPLGMGFQVHLGDEELHALLQIPVKRARRAFGAGYSRSRSELSPGCQTVWRIKFRCHIRRRCV